MNPITLEMNQLRAVGGLLEFILQIWSSLFIACSGSRVRPGAAQEAHEGPVE